MDKIPSFDSLPFRKGDPELAAWGLYGKHDQLGTLNRLTEEVVLNAAKEIKTGVRVSLNWPLDAQQQPGFGRQPFKHEVLYKAPRCVNDDVWTMNSQSSSQWDGLRHFGYQKEARFYNGVTMENIHKPGNPDDPRLAGVNGIHFWAAKGIVGRGILLDHAAWRDHIVATEPDSERGRRAKQFDPFSGHKITLADLKATAAHQGLQIQPADILFIRSGYIRDYSRRSADEIAAHVKAIPPTACGVERGYEILRWIWENFSAVAGDQPSFEKWPGEKGERMLHEILLGGWGCPIGELFDLEALSKECRKQRRYSFFLSSEPTCVRGGVASPPNALAIF